MHQEDTTIDDDEKTCHGRKSVGTIDVCANGTLDTRWLRARCMQKWDGPLRPIRVPQCVHHSGVCTFNNEWAALCDENEVAQIRNLLFTSPIPAASVYPQLKQWKSCEKGHHIFISFLFFSILCRPQSIKVADIEGGADFPID